MFLDFDPSPDPQLQAMLSAAERFLASIHAGEPPRWLTYLGSSGVGKTMLTRCIIRWAHRYQELKLDPRNRDGERYRCRVGLLRWSDCCERMLRGDYGWVPQAKHDYIVALDDLGVEHDKIRVLATSKLYEILEARRDLWTVLTCNLSAEEIAERMDSRITSRLFRNGSEVLDVKTADYNVRNRRSK